MAALQWFVLLDLKITSDLRLVWPEYAEEEGGLPKVWFIGWVCIMGMSESDWSPLLPSIASSLTSRLAKIRKC